MFLEHKPSNLYQVGQLLSNIKVNPTLEKTTIQYVYVDVIDADTGEVECRKVLL